MGRLTFAGAAGSINLDTQEMTTPPGTRAAGGRRRFRETTEMADTLAQQAMATYVKRAVADGSLRQYIAETNELYREAARVTLKAVDEHLGRPRLEPMGGLYTVVDVGSDADSFVPRALQATGVLVVPGGGFGASIKNGVRISYGPMVMTPQKIEEGLARLGTWMRGQ